MSAFKSLFGTLRPKELRVAVETAYQAGEIALPYTRKSPGAITITQKTDDSPVTEVDEKLSKFIMKELRTHFPNDIIISEEEKPEAKNGRDRIWIVDPLDGTKEFIKNNGEWCVMIGLVEKGIPRVGVVYQPVGRKMYYGSHGNGAFMLSNETEQPKQLHVRAPEKVSDLRVIGSRSHPNKKVKALMDCMHLSNPVLYGSLGLKVAKIASGEADVYWNVAGRSSMWDTLAPEVILREAGGSIVTLPGAKKSSESRTVPSKVEYMDYESVGTRVWFPFMCIGDHLKQQTKEACEEFFRTYREPKH